MGLVGLFSKANFCQVRLFRWRSRILYHKEGYACLEGGWYRNHGGRTPNCGEAASEIGSSKHLRWSMNWLMDQSPFRTVKVMHNK